MKRRTWLRLFATFLIASFKQVEIRLFNIAQGDDATSTSTPSNEDVDYFLGSNARWLINRRQGVVSAWKLDEARPLWSRDGVVFRLPKRTNGAAQNLQPIQDQPFRHAVEFFGRVYFLLDDSARQTPSAAKRPRERGDNLLISLDLRAQGRLVWARRAQEFARFFSNAPAALSFLDKIAALDNDELLIQIKSDFETKLFVLDAADGTLRRLIND